MRRELTVADVSSAVRRVRSLSDEARRGLLWGLLGRLSVIDGAALISEIEFAEAADRAHEDEAAERTGFPL